MTRQFLILAFTLLISTLGFSQSASDSLLALGNSYYKKKDFAQAGKIWFQSAEVADNKITKQTNFFYAALAYGEAKDSANTLNCLDMAITQNGFNDLPALETDETFRFLHTSAHWKRLLSSIKPVYTSDPRQAKVIATDVRNFWKAYDKTLNSTEKPGKIYKELYFDQGSMALQYYFVNKIQTVDNFVYMHDAKQKYYKSIRANSLKAARLKGAYKKSFVKLKEIYPEAIFPPIYFVVGKLRSAGTSCSYGLILGIDQACMSPTADTTELTNWEKHNISRFDELPYTVAHELIHYLQSGMAADTTLLKAALVEGMADFMGELISGKTANERLKVYAQGREKQIWKAFEPEMYLDRAENWIANADQETADKPADLGYWVGYEICKAYYEHAADKQKAIHDMLHIQDYRKFFEDSKFVDKVKSWS